MMLILGLGNLFVWGEEHLLISGGHYLQDLSKTLWKQLSVNHLSHKSALRKWSHIYLCPEPNLYSFPLWKVINYLSWSLQHQAFKQHDAHKSLWHCLSSKEVVTSAAKWTGRAAMGAPTHHFFSTTFFFQGPAEAQDHSSMPSDMFQETAFACALFLKLSELAAISLASLSALLLLSWGLGVIVTSVKLVCKWNTKS